MDFTSLDTEILNQNVFPNITPPEYKPSKCALEKRTVGTSKPKLP